MSDEVIKPDAVLTEDGHPIGEIVISDGESRVPAVSEDTKEADRNDQMRTLAAELTGEADADSSLAELFPGYVDGDKRRRAAMLFVTEHKGIDEIASAVGVPPRTVSMWAFNFKWDELLKREIASRQTQSVLDLARLRADKRYEIAMEQFDQAKRLREKAIEAVEDGETSIKSGAEAWAAAAKIEHTLSGMSEAGDITDITGTEDKSKKDGKTPLVVVIQGGGLPPVRKI